MSNGHSINNDTLVKPGPGNQDDQCGLNGVPGRLVMCMVVTRGKRGTDVTTEAEKKRIWGALPDPDSLGYSEPDYR